VEGSDYLYACVEAGVALSGFSALIIALRRREPLQFSAYDRQLVANLVERGLMAAFFSLLPILLFGLGFSERLVWLFSSGAFVAYGISIAIRSWRSRLPDQADSQLVSGALFYPLMAVGLALIAVQALHAVGLGLQQSVWWHLLAVTWLLTSAGYLFVFVLRAWVRAA
jgi:hypothetical protein